jgi:hypothetical protein
LREEQIDIRGVCTDTVFKDVVGNMIDKSVFTPSTARQYLKRKLAEQVGDRQELLIPTGESPFEKASLNHS